MANNSLLPDLGTRPPSSMGPNSFVFAYIFTKKHPHRRSTTPNECTHPPTGNPGSATVIVHIEIWLYRLIYIGEFFEWEASDFLVTWMDAGILYSTIQIEWFFQAIFEARKKTVCIQMDAVPIQVSNFSI